MGRIQVKNGFERAFTAGLNECMSEAAGLEVFAARRPRTGKGQQPIPDPPYVVFLVRELEQIADGEQVYEAEARLVLITDLQHKGSMEHDRYGERVEEALQAMPARGVNVEHGVELFGWTNYRISEAEDVDEGVLGDIYFLRAGIGRPQTTVGEGIIPGGDEDEIIVL